MTKEQYFDLMQAVREDRLKEALLGILSYLYFENEDHDDGE